jgi:methyl-accepting chemotaxis protein
MKLTDLKLRHKLMLSFGSIILLMGIIIYFSFSGVTTIMNDTKEIEEVNHLRNVMYEKHINHLNWAQKLNEHLTHHSHQQLSVELDHHKCGFGQWYYSEERELTEKKIPALKPILQEMEVPHRELHQTGIKIEKLMTGSTPELNLANNEYQNADSSKDLAYNRAAEIYKNQTMATLNKLGNHFEQIEDITDNYIKNFEADILEKDSLIKENIILFGIIALIIGIILTVIISRNITRPVAMGVQLSKSLADGDLTQEFKNNRKDEIGLLINSLREMSEKMKNVIVNIVTGADNVSQASSQLSSGAQQLSQGVTEQASSSEEVSSTMEEISSNIELNTEHAKETENISMMAAESMKKVEKASKNSSHAINKIAEKITIINDIAFQTNILALNAAVEAARAGEHGKGFAVVAAEVRKLAERSKSAAIEIDDLAKSSVNVTEEARTLIEELIPKVEKTSALVQEITAASFEQKSGAEQVSNALLQLNDVNQQSAATSEEIATNSEELSNQADYLRGLVKYFKIDDVDTQKVSEINLDRTYKNGNGNGNVKRYQASQSHAGINRQPENNGHYGNNVNSMQNKNEEHFKISGNGNGNGNGKIRTEGNTKNFNLNLKNRADNDSEYTKF